MRAETNKLYSVCGIDCTACKSYSAKQQDRKPWQSLAGKTQLQVEEFSCCGCRSLKRLSHCDQCKMFDCAWDRGYEFCYECPDYPCAELKLFRIESANYKIDHNTLSKT